MEHKQQEAHRRILEAARKLFSREYGYEKATVRQIATMADVSVGAVYLHFKSKPDILAELVSEFFEHVSNSLAEEVQPASSSKEQLRSYFLSLGRLASDSNTILFSQLLARISLKNLDRRSADTVTYHINRHTDILTGILSRGREEGFFPIANWNPRMVAVLILQSFQSLMDFMFSTQKFYSKISAGFSTQEILQAYMDFAIAALDGMSAKPRADWAARRA